MHIIIPLQNDYPIKLVFNGFNIPIPPKTDEKMKYELSQCTCKMVNYSSPIKFIELVESLRYFGVDHFTYYVTSASERVWKVLNYYEKNGIIEIVKWNKSIEMGLLKKYVNGQIWKTNDCLYRNMYNSKRLIITDLDEIVYPVKGNSIIEMLKNYDNLTSNTYYLTSRLFHLEEYPSKHPELSLHLDKSIYRTNEYCDMKDKTSSKYIINNIRDVYETEVHYVHADKIGRKVTSIPSNIAFLRHTREYDSNTKNMCINSTWRIELPDKRQEEIKKRSKTILKAIYNTIKPYY